jgi:DNA-binding XRE family transcriptional regulator
MPTDVNTLQDKLRETETELDETKTKLDKTVQVRSSTIYTCGT